MTVLWGNIQSGKESNFGPKSDNGVKERQPYDILSIMHYGDHECGPDPRGSHPVPNAEVLRACPS